MAKNNKIIAAICGAIVVVAAVVTAIIVVVNNNNNNGNGGGTSSETRGNSIVGRWKYTDSDLGDLGIDFVYTFNADGTGDYDMSGTKMEFTYKTDGNKLTITYDSGPFETEYEIKGNVLNVKDSGGNDTLYKKI